MKYKKILSAVIATTIAFNSLGLISYADTEAPKEFIYGETDEKGNPIKKFIETPKKDSSLVTTELDKKDDREVGENIDLEKINKRKETKSNNNPGKKPTKPISNIEDSHLNLNDMIYGTEGEETPIIDLGDSEIKKEKDRVPENLEHSKEEEVEKLDPLITDKPNNEIKISDENNGIELFKPKKKKKKINIADYIRIPENRYDIHDQIGMTQEDLKDLKQIIEKENFIKELKKDIESGDYGKWEIDPSNLMIQVPGINSPTYLEALTEDLSKGKEFEYVTHITPYDPLGMSGFRNASVTRTGDVVVFGGYDQNNLLNKFMLAAYNYARTSPGRGISLINVGLYFDETQFSLFEEQVLNIRKIDLDALPSKVNVSGVNRESLESYMENLSSLQNFEKLRSLNYLKFTNSELSNCDFIEGYNTTTNIILSGNRVTNLSGINKNFTSLNLENQRITLEDNGNLRLDYSNGQFGYITASLTSNNSQLFNLEYDKISPNNSGNPFSQKMISLDFSLKNAAIEKKVYENQFVLRVDVNNTGSQFSESKPVRIVEKIKDFILPKAYAIEGASRITYNISIDARTVYNNKIYDLDQHRENLEFLTAMYDEFIVKDYKAKGISFSQIPNNTHLYEKQLEYIISKIHTYVVPEDYDKKIKRITSFYNTRVLDKFKYSMEDNQKINLVGSSITDIAKLNEIVNNSRLKIDFRPQVFLVNSNVGGSFEFNTPEPLTRYYHKDPLSSEFSMTANTINFDPLKEFGLIVFKDNEGEIIIFEDLLTKSKDNPLSPEMTNILMESKRDDNFGGKHLIYTDSSYIKNRDKSKVDCIDLLNVYRIVIDDNTINLMSNDLKNFKSLLAVELTVKGLNGSGVNSKELNLRSFEYLKELVLVVNKTNISKIATPSSLDSLYLSNFRNLTILLQGSSPMKFVRINNCDLDSLTHLSGIPGIQNINLDNNKIVDLTRLKDFNAEKVSAKNQEIDISDMNFKNFEQDYIPKYGDKRIISVDREPSDQNQPIIRDISGKYHIILNNFTEALRIGEHNDPNRKSNFTTTVKPEGTSNISWKLSYKSDDIYLTKLIIPLENKVNIPNLKLRKEIVSTIAPTTTDIDRPNHGEYSELWNKKYGRYFASTGDPSVNAVYDGEMEMLRYLVLPPGNPEKNMDLTSLSYAKNLDIFNMNSNGSKDISMVPLATSIINNHPYTESEITRIAWDTFELPEILLNPKIPKEYLSARTLTPSPYVADVRFEGNKPILTMQDKPYLKNNPFTVRVLIFDRALFDVNIPALTRTPVTIPDPVFKEELLKSFKDRASTTKVVIKTSNGDSYRKPAEETEIYDYEMEMIEEIVFDQTQDSIKDIAGLEKAKNLIKFKIVDNCQFKLVQPREFNKLTHIEFKSNHRASYKLLNANTELIFNSDVKYKYILLQQFSNKIKLKLSNPNKKITTDLLNLSVYHDDTELEIFEDVKDKLYLTWCAYHDTTFTDRFTAPTRNLTNQMVNLYFTNPNLRMNNIDVPKVKHKDLNIVQKIGDPSERIFIRKKLNGKYELTEYPNIKRETIINPYGNYINEDTIFYMKPEGINHISYMYRMYTKDFPLRGNQVSIPDPKLREFLTTGLRDDQHSVISLTHPQYVKSSVETEFWDGEMELITGLTAPNKGIEDIPTIAIMKNLKTVDLSGNKIKDFTPIDSKTYTTLNITNQRGFEAVSVMGTNFAIPGFKTHKNIVSAEPARYTVTKSTDGNGLQVNLIDLSVREIKVNSNNQLLWTIPINASGLPQPISIPDASFKSLLLKALKGQSDPKIRLTLQPSSYRKPAGENEIYQKDMDAIVGIELMQDNTIRNIEGLDKAVNLNSLYLEDLVLRDMPDISRYNNLKNIVINYRYKTTDTFNFTGKSFAFKPTPYEYDLIRIVGIPTFNIANNQSNKIKTKKLEFIGNGLESPHYIKDRFSEITNTINLDYNRINNTQILYDYTAPNKSMKHNTFIATLNKTNKMNGITGLFGMFHKNKNTGITLTQNPSGTDLGLQIINPGLYKITKYPEGLVEYSTILNKSGYKYSVMPNGDSNISYDIILEMPRLPEKGNVVNFPDQKLKESLLELFKNGHVDGRLELSHEMYAKPQEDTEIYEGEMKMIKKLHLPENRGIRDLTGLDKAVNLTDLTANSNNITDIQALRNHPSLKRLNLDNNKIIQWHPIRGLNFTSFTARSQRVEIEYNPYSGKSGNTITGLDQGKLGLTGNGIRTVDNGFTILLNEPFKTKYTNVGTEINGVTYDITATPTPQNMPPKGSIVNVNEPLKSLILNELKNYGSTWKKAEFVDYVKDYESNDIFDGELKILERIEAPNKNIISLSGLDKATNLKTLILNNNKITDITPIKNLSTITTLNLNNNSILDFHNLKATGVTALNQTATLSPTNNRFTFTNIKDEEGTYNIKTVPSEIIKHNQTTASYRVLPGTNQIVVLEGVTNKNITWNVNVNPTNIVVIPENTKKVKVVEGSKNLAGVKYELQKGSYKITLTADSNGDLVLPMLQTGTYTLKQLTTKEGLIPIPKAFRINVGYDDINFEGTQNYKITNTRSLVTLPQTGTLTVYPLLLLSLAGFLLSRKYKKKEDKDRKKSE